MEEVKVDRSKRRLLLAASGVAGGIAAIGVGTPFFLSMLPSARARAAGAPVEVDISRIEPGMILRAEWRGQPVWVLHRTPEMLEDIKKMDGQVADPASDNSVQPKYAKNEYRSIKPDYLVLIGICTHLGCSPTAKLQPGAESGLGTDWMGGFFCPCHGSKFDLAGRVLKDVPAPKNLVVPPYQFLTDARLMIGDDKGAKA
ncbi:MAG: ubiquinol-cytochrome c reductase iron-sulfur subunit [Betaproteobacteria bacterium]